MAIKEARAFPPPISNYFDPKLLDRKSIPWSERLLRLYNEILLKLKNKNISPEKRISIESLKKEFMGLYGKAKEKEEQKEKVHNETKRPFYMPTISNRSLKRIFKGLRLGATSVFHSEQIIHDYQIQKVRKLRKKRLKKVNGD